MANRGINKVILIGNLGQDPEVRHIPSGGVVTNITLATSENWKDKQTGEMKEKTEWHRIVFFGKLAEIAGEYLKKGQQIYVEGSLQTRKWQDQSGHDRYTTEIVVGVNGTMQMIGNRQNQNNIVANEFQNNKWNQLKSSVHSPSEEENQILSSSKLKNKKSITENDSMLDFDDEIPF